jgi:hypothetical protein
MISKEKNQQKKKRSTCAHSKKIKVDIHALLGNCKGMFDNAATLEEMIAGNVGMADGKEVANGGGIGNANGGGANGGGPGMGGGAGGGAGTQSMSSINEIVKGMYD